MATGHFTEEKHKIDWKENILRQLKSRNRRESQRFLSLILSHNKLLESSASLRLRNVQLSVDTERLKEENVALQVKAEMGGGGGGGNERVQEKLLKLQEELTELHRKRGENSQQIIDLNNALQEKEKELHHKEAKMSDAEALNISLKSEIKNLEHTIMELEATNQMLKDEHQALQLAFTALEAKYIKCQEDNRELVERWMVEKAKDADVLNEENAVFMRKRQIKLEKELRDAAQEKKDIRPDSETGLYLTTGIKPVCLSCSIPTVVQCKFDAHEGEVNAIKFSPSGSAFATGGSDRKIKLWQYMGGKCDCRGVLTGSNAGLVSVEFNEEENLILGASTDFASRVWSVTDHRVRHTLTGHSGKVLAAKFLSDSTKVVSGSHDRTLKIWDLHSRACIKTIFAGSSCNDLVTLHNSIISGHFDRRVRFWDTRSDSSTNEISLQGRLSSLDISSDGYTLLCCARDDTLKIIDLRMNQVNMTLCADGFKVGCDWTRAVLSPDNSYAMAGSHDGSLFIWNVSKGKVEKVLKEHNHSVIACSWHPLGSTVVSCEKQKKAIVWSDF